MNSPEISKILHNINLVSQIEKLKKISNTREVVFLCVGNSKIWYDSFGPMMGTLLQYLGVENYVYGNIKSNIDVSNIQYYIDVIYKFHYNPYIVVFDNALSSNDEFVIKINKKSTTCAALSKNAVEVGDVSIMCLSPCSLLKNNCCYYHMLGEIKRLGLYFKEFYL